MHLKARTISTITKKNLFLSGRNLAVKCLKKAWEKSQRTAVKKKQLTTLGQVTISKEHPFSRSTHGFKISPRLQELMVYAGAWDSYGRADETIREFLNICVSPAQVYRVTDCYGAKIEEASLSQRMLPPVKQQEILYTQADGSMIFSREEGWKEVKVGRLFKSSDCLHAEAKQSCITHSQYLAHLGSAEQFCTQMQQLIDGYGNLKGRLVFICDGAPWIKNWIEDAFPEAVSILDYYHACEYLYGFADSFFSDKEAKNQWAEQMKELLLDSRVDCVMETVRLLDAKGEDALKLIAYFETNRDRMDYKHYRSIGCGIIGSGAIESAHRTVVQKRMKLSGQRWSRKGAQNMLKLRVTYMNDQYSKIIDLIKADAQQAA
jgi:Uncharacterised protein family (UPF0236)